MHVDTFTLKTALAEAFAALEVNPRAAVCTGIIGRIQGRRIRLTVEPDAAEWGGEELELTGYERSIRPTKRPAEPAEEEAR
jgi:hypothetical protein